MSVVGQRNSLRTRAFAARLLCASLALAIPTAVEAAIFGLVDTGELYSSTNGGSSWSILATLPVSDAVGLAAGSSSSQLYIVTRSGSVYQSTDAGTNWSGVGTITASDVSSFTINYDASVLALTESGTLYRSTDGGVTFTGLAALTGSNFVSLIRGPIGRMYVLTRSGEIYESQNQGSTWAAVGSVTVSNAVAIRRKAAELYILTKTGEVYRSINLGRAWLPVGAITASNMRAILDNSSALLAAAETGEVYSSANGVSWTAIGAINQLHVMALGGDAPLATGVAVEETAPRFAIRAPYPNPALASAGSTFAFETTTNGWVRLQVFDVAGRLVAEREPEALAFGGAHEIHWRPAGMRAGTYFVRLTTDTGRSASLKWSLVR